MYCCNNLTFYRSSTWPPLAPVRSSWDRDCDVFGVIFLSITVINRRPELIGYYLRRGFVPTGETLPFPHGDGPSAALVDGLELVVLEKTLK